MTDDTTEPLATNGKVPDVVDVENGVIATYVKGDETVDVKPNEPLIGLSKEELEKYRDSPFWKPLRLIMFVLFWVAWVAMFAGAILIVVLSPKCGIKKTPEWWKAKVSYQVFTPSFRDADGNGIGDFKGIEQKLEQLRKIGIQNIWATPVIATQKDDFSPSEVIDFSMVDERFGTMDDFQMMLDRIHNYDMHFVMDLPIAITSVQHKWFEDAKKGGKFKNFYVWRKQADVKGDPNFVPLANSQEAYLIHDGKNPVLNWENSEVKKAMLEVAKQYIELGVDGFHLMHVNQLMEHQGEKSGKIALDAVEGFKNDLEKYVEESGYDKKIVVFCSLNDMENVQPHNAEDYHAASLEYIIDDSIAKLDQSTCPEGVAQCLYIALTKSLHHFERSQLPHVWQFTNRSVSRPTSRFGEENGNLMTFVQMTLPGAVEVYYGQEMGLKDTENSPTGYTGLMQWDKNNYAGFTYSNQQPFFRNTPDADELNYDTQYSKPASYLKTFKRLAKLRQRDDNIAFGAMNFAPQEGDVIMYNRVHHDHNSTATVGSAYVVVTNFGSKAASVDIKPMIPADRSSTAVEVVALTPGIDSFIPRDIVDFSTEQLQLPAHQGILLKL